MNSAVETTLWRFVRGDMPSAEFEAWLYTHDELEAELGQQLYLDLVSLDYRDKHALFALRESLASGLRPPLKCECITLPDLAVVPMGGEGLDARVFATLNRVREHGGPQWWLYLSTCDACGQDWLVAQEERIFDDYFLKRLNAAEASQIMAGGRWPVKFMTYERVLTVGYALSHPCRFVDPLAASLVWTVQDLRKERPEITSDEIARLLGVAPAEVDQMLAANFS
jgi:hypothetical protein